MQIKYQGKNKFIIKTKEATVTTGDRVSIGDYQLDGVGEYENCGVEAKVLSDTAFIFSKDSVSVLWVAQTTKFSKVLEKNNLGSIEVVMLAMGDKGVSVKIAKQILATIEPKIAVVADAGALSEFCAERTDCPPPENFYKVNKNDLESETSRIVVLA